VREGGSTCVRLSVALVVIVALVVTVARATFGGERVARDARRSDARDDTRDAAIAALGRKLFFDSTLSASGRMSCASCHDPAHAYAAPNSPAVQLGGPNRDIQGMRAVPSLRYVLNRTPVWYKEYAGNPAERAREANEPPVGGFGADGRFNSLRAQAQFPLLAPNEMANRDTASVVVALARASYADEFRRIFGGHVFDTTSRAFSEALYAIERFELTDSSFHPYDSKYDLYLDGKVALTPQERRGLALFDDPKHGGCSACHLDRLGADGSHPLFTDYQFGALGVPRNPELVANRDPAYFDEGLCGPARADQAMNKQYCGMFKTPTLRNVATRGTFFHNGRFHTLREALAFYVRRDTDPAQWYSRASLTRVIKFDDLPRELRGNVDTLSEPLTRHAGERPAWSDADIDDVIAFLKTLTDGYRAPANR
jgi:cytochrome c peroxidase